MIWAQTVLSLILGLIAISWQNVQAEVSFISTRPHFEAPPLADNFLYMYFACRDKPTGLRLPIAGSCIDYYECQEGMAHRLTCKEGFHFSNLGLTCLDARLSKCKPEQLEDNVKCEGPCCSRKDGLYPAKDSCSDFLICVNEQTYEKSCGRFLQFSAENSICDIPERARCSVVVDKDIVDKEEEVEEQDNLSKPVLYKISKTACRNLPDGYCAPIFGSCNQFYLCVGQVGYLKSCGALQFNPETHYCDARTRIYCPLDEATILDEEEYAAVDTLPMPMPLPRPKPLENNVEILNNRPHSGKKPVVSESLETDKKPVSEPRPNAGKRPKPPVSGPAQEKEEEQLLVDRPHVGNMKPAPQEEEQKPHSGKQPRPPFTVEEEDEEKENENELMIDIEEEHVPVNKPHGGNKKPLLPEPPYIELPVEEQLEDNHAAVGISSYICADKAVGALMAMPGDCSKYIRCRWDWYERRVAEVLSCPQDMHFNAKSKYCDWPVNAGCIAFGRKEIIVNTKKDKF